MTETTKYLAVWNYAHGDNEQDMYSVISVFFEEPKSLSLETWDDVYLRLEDMLDKLKTCITNDYMSEAQIDDIQDAHDEHIVSAIEDIEFYIEYNK